jgi:lipopolysaccharide transport system permease protein
MSTTNHLNATLPAEPAEIGRPAPQADPDPSLIETVIRARSGWIAVNWAELIQSHELFYTLVQRDLMVRYKQSVLGVAWAVIQPVLQMIIYSIIFGRMTGITLPDGIPYSLFVYVGVVPWTFFANSTNGATLSLVNNQNLLTKIYFPRLYVPAATIGSFLVDMAIGFGLLAILMPLNHVWPTWNILALPLVVLFTFAATVGVGLSLAAMTLLYRDIRFVVPFAIQLMIFLSGVIVPMDQYSWKIRYVAALNPMFGAISATRSSVLGMPWDFVAVGISLLSASAILTFGLFFFRKTERLIADIV